MAFADTGAASILHVCLFDSASDTRFLSRMSSRSGDDRSGRNGTKMGPLLGEPGPALDGLARLGCGATTADGTVVDGAENVAGDGSGIGYCEGWTGFGSKPDVLVNGWTARGSKEASTEDLDMAVEMVLTVAAVDIVIVSGGE